jgi:hypothetical protein
MIKNYNLFFCRTSDRTSKLQKKPSALKREHPSLKHEIFYLYSTFVGPFCPPGSGFRIQIRIRIH